MISEIILLLEAIGIIGLALFFIVNKNFTYGIYMWLMANLFFKYQKISMMDSILPDLSLDRLLFIFLLVVFIGEILVRKRKIFSFTKVEYSMFFFCLFVAFSMIWTDSMVKEGSRLAIGNLLTGYVIPFSMFFIAQNVYDSHEKRRGFLKFVILVGIYLSFTAIFEHLNIDKLVFPKYILDEEFGIHFGRARGPFCQAAVNGTALGFAFSALFYFLFNLERGKIWKIYSMILLVVSPLALFFTYTRAVWLGAMVSFAIICIFIFKQNQKTFVIIAVIFCVLILIIAPHFLDYDTLSFANERMYQEEPINDRLSLYVVYLNMFMSNPIFGVGFMKFKDNAPEYFSNVPGVPFNYTGLSQHDTFSGILAEMGGLGMIFILIIYISILLSSVRLYKKLKLSEHELKSMIVIFWGFMAVYLVNAFCIEMRYFEFVNSIFFIFAGIIYRCQRELCEKIA